MFNNSLVRDEIYTYVIDCLKELRISKRDIVDIKEWKNTVYTIIFVKTNTKKIYRFIYCDQEKKNKVAKKLTGSLFSAI